MLRVLLQSVLSARGGALGMIQTGGVQILIMFINLSTGILTARWLGPVGRGDFAVITLWFMLPASISTAGLQAGIVFTSRHRPESAKAIGFVALAFGLAIYVPVAAASLFLLPFWLHEYDAHIRTLSAIAVLSSALNLCVMLSRQSLLGMRRITLFNASCAASPAIYLVALLICGLAGSITIDTAFFSQIATIATTATIALFFYVGQRHVRWGEIRAIRTPLLSYSVKAASIDLVNIFYGNADRLILIGFVGPAELGFYAVALSFARLISILQTAVSSVLLVDLAGKPAPEIETYVHNLFRTLFWVLACSCGFAILAGEPILVLFFGRKFAASASIFKALIVETSISCLCQVIMEAFLASNRPGYPSRVQLVYSIVLVAALLTLIPVFGGVGAAVAMLIAALVKMALLLLGLSRIDICLPRISIRGSDYALLQRLILGRLRPSQP